MIGKINNNQIRDIPEELSSRQPKSGGHVSDSDKDVSVQVNYASLMEQAIQDSEADADLIRRARDLVRSGRLENPQIVRKAAENIIMFGI